MKCIALVNLIGGLLMWMVWVCFPFFNSMGYAVFICFPILLVLTLFVIAGVLTLKNLKKSDPDVIRTLFVLVLVVLGFHGLGLNDMSLEWLGLLLVLTVIGIGIKVRNPLVKLELVNWAGLGVLVFYGWLLGYWIL